VRFFYSVLVYLLRPIAFAVVLWRGLRNPVYWAGLRERFGLGAASPSPAIWLRVRPVTSTRVNSSERPAAVAARVR